MLPPPSVPRNKLLGNEALSGLVLRRMKRVGRMRTGDVRNSPTDHRSTRSAERRSAHPFVPEGVAPRPRD